MTEAVFKVFVSSPGDTTPERELVRGVLERLNRAYAGQARLEPLFWEDAAYSAHATFQNQIVESASCDLVVAIFKHRLGTPLPDTFPKRMPDTGEPYPSGTGYEVLSAIAARRAGKKLPDILVYRRPEPEWPPLSGDPETAHEILQQYERLQQFFLRYFRTAAGEFQAAYKTYRSVDDLEDKVEADVRDWLTRHHIHAHAVWDRAQNHSPFPGLAAYGAERAQIFFGRQQLIDRAVRAVRGGESAARRRFVLLLGASGSGKSSLLLAGVVPKLASVGAVPGVKTLRVAQMAAGAGLFVALATALLDPACLGPELRLSAFGSPELLARQLRADPGIAWVPVRDALKHAVTERAAEGGSQEAEPAELLLVLDQIERCFTESTAAETQAFFALLERGVADQMVTILGAIRSDSYAGVQQVPALLRLRQAGGALDVLPLEPAELEDMLVQTVAACAPPLRFDTDGGSPPESLSRVLARDAAGGDALPLLQVALAQLYDAQEQRKDNVLARSDYRGLDAAVTDRANAALALVDAKAAEQLKPLVLSMVRDVRRDAAGGEWQPVLAPLSREDFERRFPAARPLLDALVNQHLLVSDAGDDGVVLRPTHESLLRIWPRARELVQAHASQLHVRSKLEASARNWQEAPSSAKDEYLQLPALDLAEGAKLLQDEGPVLPEALRDFITQAQARARAQRRKTSAFKATVMLAATAALIVIATLGMSVRAKSAANQRMELTTLYLRTTSTIETIEEQKRAESLLRAAAIHGTAMAQWLFANLLQNRAYSGETNATRIGVVDPNSDYALSAEAMQWYLKAANQGLPEAQFSIGFAYDTGSIGLPDAPNNAKAVEWYRKAAHQGYADAQYHLGVEYDLGSGVDKNPTQSAKWMRKAAYGGNELAQLAIGDAYATGNGVQKNAQAAAKWYRMAADQGNAWAQFDLGMAYHRGAGVPRNDTQAAMWLMLAKASAVAMGGDALATDIGTDAQLAKVTRQLTPSQLADVQRQAKAWQATHPQ